MEAQQELCTLTDVESPKNVPIESTGRTNTDTTKPMDIKESRGLKGKLFNNKLFLTVK